MKRKILILSVLAILIAILAAGSLAYYTADTKAHNVITTGDVTIRLNEWADEARTEKFESPVGVMPGTEVTKIVEVENVGTGSAWVRVELTVEVWMGDEYKEELPAKPVHLMYGDTAGCNTTDWTYQDDGYYYYNKPLAPGETTEPLFTSVAFDDQMGNEYQNSTAHVNVNAYAVQSATNGEDVLSANGWPLPTPIPEPTVAPTPETTGNP